MKITQLTFVSPEYTGHQSKQMNTLNNSVRLTGFLGGEPEMKLTENRKKFAKISLATNSYRKNNKGETVDEVTWHQIYLWDRHAELAEKFLAKGSKVAIEGRLVNHYYTDKDGAKRYATEVVVNEIDFFTKAGKN